MVKTVNGIAPDGNGNVNVEGGSGGVAVETDPTVPAWAKTATKPTYTASEVGLGNVDNVKQYSASNPPPYPVTSVNGKTGDVTIEIPQIEYPVTSVNGQTGDVTIEIPEVPEIPQQMQSDWNQSDETSRDFIKNKPDESDALALLAEVGFVEPVADADGSIYTDENGNIYTLI